MNEGANGHKKALKSTDDHLAQTIGNHINDGTKKADSLFSSARIYRVPKELRKGKKSAYTPRLVAIGPLHCNDKHLQPMQDVKMCYTDHLIRRVTKGLAEGPVEREKRSKVLQDCVKELTNCIDVAKKFYAEIIITPVDEEEGLSLSDDDLVEMMLVDGCFILELLYRRSRMTKKKDMPKEEEGQGGKHNGASQSGSVSHEPNSSSDPSEPLLQEIITIGDGMNPWLGPEEGVDGENTSSSSQKHLDPIFDRRLPLITVQQDLALLENQIPFFVLEKLFTHTVEQIPKDPNRPNDYSLPKYVSLFFGDILSPNEPSHQNEKKRSSANTESATRITFFPAGNTSTNSGTKKQNYDHILHILHENQWPVAQRNEEEHDGCCQQFFTKLLPLAQKEKKKTVKLIPKIPCASELIYAGVKFVPGTGINLFKVKFTKPTGPFWWCHRACFEIPPLDIYDQTEVFFRNLIAYEQCCPRDSQISSFTTYAYLMDMLVNSDKDIEVLEKAEVIHNYLGSSKDATHLFNNLCKETVIDVGGDPFFVYLCNDALEYSKWLWPRNLAHIRRTYFASPWTFIAFLGALSLLSWRFKSLFFSVL